MPSVLKFLITTLLLSAAIVPVLAQSYDDNLDPARSNVIFTPPRANPSQGLPPPPGSGDPRNGAVSPKVTPGDPTASKPPVSTGLATSEPEYGTYFDHEDQSFRPRVNLLVNRGTQTVNGMSVNRRTRVALTLQPDEIPDSKRSQIEGMLGLSSGGLNSPPYQNITVSQSTLEQIENTLYLPAQPSGSTYSYPGTPGDNVRNTPWQERSYIAGDHPGQGYPRYQSTTILTTVGSDTILHPRQEIRDFCLYLVIAGVVIACIQLVVSGAFMAFGHPYAGSKAIAAAGGLMLLLMAFAIWKVDMTNMLMARGQPNGRDSFDIRNPPPPDPTTEVTSAHHYTGDMTLPPDKKSEADQDTAHPTVNLPATPAPGTGQAAPRGGLQLLPLGAAH